MEKYRVTLTVSVHGVRTPIRYTESAWGSMGQCLDIGLRSVAPPALTHPRRGSPVSWW